MKVSGIKYIFLILYVDYIFLAVNDTDLLVETKQLLFSYFDMMDLVKHLMSWAYRYFAIDLVAYEIVSTNLYLTHFEKV